MRCVTKNPPNTLTNEMRAAVLANHYKKKDKQDVNKKTNKYVMYMNSQKRKCCLAFNIILSYKK